MQTILYICRIKAHHRTYPKWWPFTFTDDRQVVFPRTWIYPFRPEEMRKNFRPEEMRKNFRPEEMRKNFRPEEMRRNFRPEEMRRNLISHGESLISISTGLKNKNYYLHDKKSVTLTSMNHSWYLNSNYKNEMVETNNLVNIKICWAEISSSIVKYPLQSS